MTACEVWGLLQRCCWRFKCSGVWRRVVCLYSSWRRSSREGYNLQGKVSVWLLQSWYAVSSWH